MLDKDIKNYIDQLISEHASIQSIWLFGSRINGTSRPDSDWDFLIFGTQETLDKLRQHPELKQPNIDLLIVYNGDDFEEPWPDLAEKNKPKSGSLIEWRWTKINDYIAHYEGTKGFEGSNGNFYVEPKLLTANRVFPELMMEKT